MKFIRYVFFSIFSLVAISSAGIALLFTKEPRDITLPSVGVVQLNLLSIGITVLILFLAIWIFPRSSGVTKIKQIKTKGHKKLSNADTKKQLQKQLDHANKTAVSGGTDLHSVDLQELDAPSQADIDALESDVNQENAEAMSKLIAMGQSEMSIDKLRQLLLEYYPDLKTMVDHIGPDHKSTIDTVSRHIIGIARFTIKIKDKSLATEQFAIFQEKSFQAEKENILRIYKPDNVEGLNAKQYDYVGFMVDRRDYDKLQRIILGSRDDWKEISIANAKDYL